MMNKMIKKMIALVCSASIMLTSASNVYAKTEFSQPKLFGQENTSPFKKVFHGKMYEIIDDKAKIRESDKEKANLIRMANKNSFVRGEMEKNSIGKKWLRIYLESGDEAYIYSGHVKEHEHAYFQMMTYGGETAGPKHHFDVCKCGYARLVYDGDYYVDCDSNNVLCHLASGSWTDSSNVYADAVNLAYDVGTVAVCYAASVPETYQPAFATACTILSSIGIAASTRDFGADIVHKDPVNGALDAAGIVLGANGVYETMMKVDGSRVVKIASNFNDGVSILQDIAGLAVDIRGSFSQGASFSAPHGNHPFGNIYSIKGYIVPPSDAGVELHVEVLDPTANVVLSHKEWINEPYQLFGSPFDQAMVFNKLPKGFYVYRVYTVEEYDNGRACMRFNNVLAETAFHVS